MIFAWGSIFYAACGKRLDATKTKSTSLKAKLARSKSGKDVFAPLKTRSSRRTIELGEPLIASLNRQRERLQAKSDGSNHHTGHASQAGLKLNCTRLHTKRLFSDFSQQEIAISGSFKQKTPI